MTLIRRPYELYVQTRIKAMLYGQAGTGKTTTALSAPKPLLLDFDGGVHRVNYGHQCPTVQINSWEEANEVLKEDLSEFESIVVDTIGKMMDYIISYVCNGGIPQIKDWNRINQEFATFVRNINSMDKNVIIVAHRDVRKEGDDNVFVPALREKSYTAIVSELDLLGYVEMKGNDRTITFNPTSRNDGKNTCNLPALMKLPNVVDQKTKGALENTFLQRQIIDPYVANLQQRLTEAKKYESITLQLREDIQLITDALSAKDFTDRIESYEHVGNSKLYAKQLLQAKLKELKLKYNAQTKEYEPAA